LSLRDDSQHNRLLTIDFPRKDGPTDAVVVVNKLVAQENLSRDFRFHWGTIPPCGISSPGMLR